jgi:RHS repeat-associated protein
VSIATGATSTVIGWDFWGAPQSITFGPDGNLYVSRLGNYNYGYLTRLNPKTGVASDLVNLVSSNGAGGGPLASDGTALWWVLMDNGSWRLEKYLLATGARTTVTTTVGTAGLVSAGSYLYSATATNVLRIAKTDGAIGYVAGTNTAGYADGTSTEAWFSGLSGLATDGAALYAVDSGNRRLRRMVDGDPLSRVADSTTGTTLAEEPYGVATVAGDGVSGTADGSGYGARFTYMGGAAYVGGYVYVGSAGAIRKIDAATGQVFTLAGSATDSSTCTDSQTGSSARFQSVDDITSDGRYLYVTGACGTGSGTYYPIRRISIATGAVSSLGGNYYHAYHLTYAPDGYLYYDVTDSNTIYRVDLLSGSATAFASVTRAGWPYVNGGDLVADATDIYVSFKFNDGGFWGGTDSYATYKVPLAGGGASTMLGTFGMRNFAVAGQALYGSDAIGNTLIKADKTTGATTTIAGWGDPGWSDGYGPEAGFNDIRGVASDGKWLWIADASNYRVRVAAMSGSLMAGGDSFGIDGYAGIDDDVNPASGNYVRADEDVRIAAPGPELAVERTYNSLDTRNGPFGVGWMFGYGMRADRMAGGSVAIIHPDGRREIHKRQPIGTYLPPPGYFSTLTDTASGGFELAGKDGTTHTFSSSGALTETADDNGRHLSLTYDGSGKLSRVGDATSGRGLTFSWTGSHITAVSTDSVAAHGGALTWRYAYDGNRLTKVCDPRNNDPVTGSCVTYTWTGNRITKTTRPKGNTDTQVSYRADGRVDWKKDGIGNATTYAYPAVRRTEVTDARTNKVVKEYDGSNRLVKETDALSKVTTFEYYAYGNRSRVVDANNNSTSMTYDVKGNLQSLTNGEGKTTYMAYDDGGNKILAADQRSSGPTDITYATQFEYDAAGNVTKETSPGTADFPAGTVRRWTYTNGTEPAIGGGTMPAKLLRTEIDQRQRVTTRSYDSRGDLREVIDPVGQRTTYTCDELGRKTSETVYSDTHPAGVTTTFTYTKLSQEEQTTGPVTTPAAGGSAHQRRTTKVYDGNGNVIELHDEDLVGGDQARVSIYTYDDDDREKSVTDPEGGVQSRTFDPVGNVATVTDAESRVTATEYDARNLPLKVTLKDFVDDPVAGSTPRDVVLAEYGYDSGRRKTSEKDALGRVVSLTYDRADHITKTTLVGFHNRDGSTRDIVRKETVYDPAGHVTRELGGNGTRRVDHVFDAAGRRTSSTADPAGLNRTTAWVYDAAGNVLTETLSDANRTEQTRRVFDDGGRMVSETVENGATDLTTTYTYDQLDNKTSVVEPRGNAAGANPDDFRTTFVYDELSQKARTIAPVVTVEENGASSTAQPTTETGYNTFGEVIRSRDARGATTSRTVDRLGRTVTVAHPSYTAPDGTTVNPTESYVYDHVGNVTQRTDRRGATTDFTFDKRNRVVRELDPLVAGESARGTTRHTYDDAGNRLSTVDEIGARVERTYDDLNRMRTETNVVRQPGGDARYTSTFDYDDLDDPTYLQNPAGDTTTQAWSAVGELRSVTDPTSKTTTHDYDVAGRRVRSTDPLSRASTVAFDQAGRVSAASRVAPNGTVLTTTSFGYDEVGNRTSVTSARGYTTTYAFDRLGRATGTVQPVDAGHSITTSYGYDPAGNRTRTTDGNGHTTWQTYNVWNLAEETVEPATAAHPTLADRRWRTKYDAAGEPVHDELPGGVVVDRTFDALGRLRTESGSGSGGSGVSPATRTLGWDLSGRQTSVSHPDGQAVFSYDDRDLLVQATSPTDSSSFAYDAAGRMTSRSDAAGAAAFTWTARSELKTATDPITGATRTYTWDPAGELESVSYGSAQASRTYGYDDLGRLTSDELKKADGTRTEREVYGYDADDNMTSQLVELAGNSAAGQSTYGYDRAGRLASWTKPDLSTVAYGWDDAGNRTSAGSQTYTYDERNRLTSGPDGAYSWSARGTLQSVVGASATTTYGFDALGRLVDYNGGASYSYDGLGRVVHRNGDVFTYAGTEMDPTGDGGALYSRSPGGDLLALSSGGPSGVSGIVGRNRHGDVTHLFNAAGTVASTRTFDPFGDVLAATGYAPQVGYQGDWTDPASGKVWMGARWYDAQDASFASRDTVGGDLTNPVSLNRYTYAFGDPMDFFDPDGHWGIRLGGLRKLFGGFGFGVGRSVSTSSTSMSPAVQAMVKTASQLALESGGVQVQRGNERPRMLGTSNVPAPANWSTMSGPEKYHYLREHDPSIRKIKLANPMSAKGLLTDAGKGFVTGGAAITDAGVSMVTLGHGPQIGPIFPEARFQLAYKVARPVASIGFSIGVAGGLSSAANGVRGSMLLRGSLKVGAEFAGGALGAKGADSKASARTMIKDGLVSVASFGVGRATGKVFKEAKVAMAARRANRLEAAVGEAIPPSGGTLRVSTAGASPAGEGGLPISPKTVHNVAEKYGVSFPETTKLTVRGGAPPWYTGATWSSSEVDLYEGAFSSEENLARTLFHERLHVFQHATFGTDTVLANIRRFEDATYAAEHEWWKLMGGK